MHSGITYTHKIKPTHTMKCVAASVLFTLLSALPLHSQSEANFRRGDANQIPGVDLSDAVCILGYLFVGVGPCSQPECLDALDTNDDEFIDISDSVNLLSYLFTDELQAWQIWIQY